MRVTNRSIHAVEALALLALGDPRKPRTVQSISDTVGISVSYTEQIFATLRSAGFVRAEKGPGGGYYLSEPADEIRVADIVAATEHSKNILQLRRMAAPNRHSLLGPSPTEQLWETLDGCIHKALAGISLADLARPHH